MCGYPMIFQCSWIATSMKIPNRGHLFDYFKGNPCIYLQVLHRTWHRRCCGKEHKLYKPWGLILDLIHLSGILMTTSFRTTKCKSYSKLKLIYHKSLQQMQQGCLGSWLLSKSGLCLLAPWIISLLLPKLIFNAPEIIFLAELQATHRLKEE